MSFVNERTVQAVRKARHCAGCSVMVNVGETAISWAGNVDGEFQAAIYHPDCRDAEIALNKAHETFYPEDWMGLDDMEWEDHPWLLEKHPAVAGRMNITAETVRADREEAEACRAAWSRTAPVDRSGEAIETRSGSTVGESAVTAKPAGAQGGDA